MMSEEKKVIDLAAIISFALFAAFGLMGWYRSGLQSKQYERQGIHLTQWECFMDVKPAEQVIQERNTMILHENGEFGTLDGKPIIRWEVRFITIRGWFNTHMEAVQDATLINMPFEMIKAHAVAVTEDNQWEPAC